MNLQSGGIILIVVVTVICMILIKRKRGRFAGSGPLRAWLSKVLPASDTVDEDPVEMGATALVDGARASNKILYAPSHLWFQCDVNTRGFILANPAGLHNQLVARANELGDNEARRRNCTWNRIRGVTMNYPIAIGPNAVEVSFTEFETSPFQAPDFESTAFPSPYSATDFLRREAETVPHADPFTPDPRWTAGTIPPRQRSPHTGHAVVVKALIAGNEPKEATIRLREGATSFHVGRDSSCELVLPNLPGISAKHLMITLESGHRYVTDMSTHGSWIESETGWKALPAGQKTPVPAGSRLLLDADQQVVLSLAEGERQ